MKKRKKKEWKMTSKRALFILMINQREAEDGWKLVDLKTNEKVSIDDCCDIVIKDLDRLEKLEKVIEILKKALLLNVKEVRGSYYVLGYDNNYCMTKEEYELLKEALENDK